MQSYQKAAQGALYYITTLLKWLACAIVIGGICGLVGVGFHNAVELATETRMAHGWLIWLLPAGGLLIVFLYRAGGMGDDKGTNLIIQSVRTGDRPPLRLAPLIFIGTVVTHLLGGSSGREGAALQIGGSIGAGVGKLLRLNDKDMRVIIMCGMSAVFAAIFGTPLTACIFAMEVISVGVLYYAAIVPCLLSSIIGYAIAYEFGVAPVSFAVSAIPALNALSLAKVILLAGLCALLSILFCVAMHAASKYYQKWIPNQYLRVAAGGALVILLTLLVGSRDYNGAGMDIISSAIGGTARPEAFILKIIFTALTLGAGFKGGEIVPTFFIGSTFGCVMAPLLGLPAGFGASLGLVAMFCGVVNCPITSLLLSIELFGTDGILLYAVGCAISYLLSGYYSLYSSQKFVYSKLRTEHVERETH